jgi:phosphoribosylformylglycinamidine cyclo-ligase
MYQDTGKSFFSQIAQDTVATFVNDLISVGATPVVTNAYWSSSSYQWLADQKLTEDFIQGWRAACDAAHITWGGGETQALSGIIQDGALELAGSAFGVIKPKEQLVTDTRLQEGDAILLLASSGVHANGISLTRELAAKLSDGYAAKLPSGALFGETLLAPTHLYAAVVRAFFDEGLDIHYLSNITGHGWRKLMRGRPEFSYVIDELPPAPEIFGFIAEHAQNDETEMYGTYNMGAGYAVYLPHDDAVKAQSIAKNHGIEAWLAGTVTKGPKQVIIRPKNITFKEGSLEVR